MSTGHGTCVYRGARVVSLYAGERGTLPTVHSLQIAPVTGSGGEPYRERDREPVVE